MAAVSAGGVPPSPTAVQHKPPGGGVGQLIKDTFAPAAAPVDGTKPPQDTDRPGDSSSSGGGGGYNREQGAQATDLSEVLPSDEAMVYGGELHIVERFNKEVMCHTVARSTSLQY